MDASINIVEAARYLDIPTEDFDRYVFNGGIPYQLIKGRKHFTLATLDNFAIKVLKREINVL